MEKLCSYEELYSINNYGDITDSDVYVISCIYYSFYPPLFKQCLSDITFIDPYFDSFYMPAKDGVAYELSKKYKFNYSSYDLRISVLKRCCLLNHSLDPFYGHRPPLTSYKDTYKNFSDYLSDYYLPAASAVTVTKYDKLYKYVAKRVTEPSTFKEPLLLIHNPFAVVDENNDLFREHSVYFLAYFYMHNRTMFDQFLSVFDGIVSTCSVPTMLYAHCDPNMYLSPFFSDKHCSSYFYTFYICTKIYQNTLTNDELLSFLSHSDVRNKMVLLSFLNVHDVSTKYVIMLHDNASFFSDLNDSIIPIYTPLMGDITTLTHFKHNPDESSCIQCYRYEEAMTKYFYLENCDENYNRFVLDVELNEVSNDLKQYHDTIQI